MPNVECKVCMHPQRAEIESAVAGGMSFRNVAAKFGEGKMSNEAVRRHWKRHARNAIVLAAQRRDAEMGDELLDQMTALQQEAWATLVRARRSGDDRAVLVAVDVVRKIIESWGDLNEKAKASSASKEPAFVCRMVRIGEAPMHEWEELPAEWLKLLPGANEGRLFLVRPKRQE